MIGQMIRSTHILASNEDVIIFRVRLHTETLERIEHISRISQLRCKQSLLRSIERTASQGHGLSTEPPTRPWPLHLLHGLPPAKRVNLWAPPVSAHSRCTVPLVGMNGNDTAPIKS
jgi:hypothetical protein